MGRPRGIPMSDEVKRKLSAITKAQWADPETRARRVAATKAALADPERRRKMSKAKATYWVKHPAWHPPAEHLRYFQKLLRCGYTKAQAREIIEQMIAQERAA